MRTLAMIAFSFASGIFLAVYLPWDGWQLWTATALLLLAVIALAALRGKKQLGKRAAVILCALALSLAYYTAYDELVAKPMTQQCGEDAVFSGVVADYPVTTDTGVKVTIHLAPFVKAVYYGDEELLSLQPGQRIGGTAYWQDAGCIHDSTVRTFTSKGVYALLYGKDVPTVEDGEYASIFFLPQRAAQRICLALHDFHILQKAGRIQCAMQFVAAVFTHTLTFRSCAGAPLRTAR